MNKFDKFYMELAMRVANFSYCKRKQVGAVFVKDDVICIGYNGTISGRENNCEDSQGETLPDVLHAESNMLSKIMNTTITSTGGTVYCTFSACVSCSKMLIQAKIKRFVYMDTHSDQYGLELMRGAGIIVERMEMSGNI